MSNKFIRMAVQGHAPKTVVASEREYLLDSVAKMIDSGPAGLNRARQFVESPTRMGTQDLPTLPAMPEPGPYVPDKLPAIEGRTLSAVSNGYLSESDGKKWQGVFDRIRRGEEPEAADQILQAIESALDEVAPIVECQPHMMALRQQQAKEDSIVKRQLEKLGLRPE